MAMTAGLLTSPLVLASVATIVTAGIAVFASGALKYTQFEPRFGLAALCAMKWQDFANLVTAFLGERGLLPARGERNFGDGGIDLLLERGTSSYLVVCKNASQHRVETQSVIDLQRAMQHNDAEGAFVVACGQADPATLELARSRGVEIIAGDNLWRQINHLLPYDVRDDAEAAAQREGRRRLLFALIAALVVGGLTYVAVAVLGAPPAAAPQPAVAGTPRNAATPAATTAPPQNATPPVAAAPASNGLPDPTLTDAQLESRRATAAMEVRSIPGIDDATWSTKSTLAITLPVGTGAIPDTLIGDVCRILLQYEEQRFTRLQLDVALESEDAAPIAVRWRQCR